jgi:predicted  nucleic acid-binding Zn-ribbon protein|nr:MAG TPA: hypothetical protein [Caudoviricetes sp.]
MKFNIVPKYKKKVSVADIKQYLVDEFDNSKKLQNEVYHLQDELKKAKEYEVKYNLSLVTLDNYKERVTNVNERNKQLESQIKSFQNTIKQDKYEIADLKLENKKMEKYINNIEKNIRKDIIKEYREKIAELKGHITKANILTLLK